MCYFRMSAWVSNMIVELFFNIFYDAASEIFLED